jgi:hypothetical protein
MLILLLLISGVFAAVDKLDSYLVKIPGTDFLVFNKKKKLKFSINIQNNIIINNKFIASFFKYLVDFIDDFHSFLIGIRVLF